MCASSVWGVCATAVVGTQNDQEERLLFCLQKQTLNFAATNQYTVQQSDATATVLQAHAFVPVVAVYVCVAGAQQQQEIEPRTTLARPMQCSNRHRRTSYWVYEAYSCSKICILCMIAHTCTCNWNVFPPLRAPKSLPILTSSKFVKNRVSSGKGVKPPSGRQVNPILKRNLANRMTWHETRRKDPPTCGAINCGGTCAACMMYTLDRHGTKIMEVKWLYLSIEILYLAIHHVQ